MSRAATTRADPCTGARGRDFLLGLRHSQLAGAQVPSWCSWHGVDAGCSQRAGPPGELTTCAYQTLADGTGVDAPDGISVPEWWCCKGPGLWIVSSRPKPNGCVPAETHGADQAAPLDAHRSQVGRECVDHFGRSTIRRQHAAGLSTRPRREL